MASVVSEARLEISGCISDKKWTTVRVQVDQEERTDNPDSSPEVRAPRTGREENSTNQKDGKLYDGSNNRGRNEL